VAAHSNGSVAFGCSFYGTLPFGGLSTLVSAGEDDLCLVLLNANGDVIWRKKFGDEGNNQQALFGGFPGALAFDSTGAVLFSGTFTGTIDFGGGPLSSADAYGDIYLAKFTAGGQWAWSKRYGSSNIEFVNGIAVAPSGSVGLVGAFTGSLAVDTTMVTSAGGYDALVVIHDADGAVSWVRRFGDSQPQSATGITFVGERPVIVGSFQSAVDIGLGALTSAGSTDIFVGHLDEIGEAIWHRRFGDPNAEAPSHVLSQVDGLTVVGDFEGTIDLGEGPLSSVGAKDIFVVKMTK
jgi:hypothetical protein